MLAPAHQVELKFVANAIPPPFTGNDYFCESGHPGMWQGRVD